MVRPEAGQVRSVKLFDVFRGFTFEIPVHVVNQLLELGIYTNEAILVDLKP